MGPTFQFNLGDDVRVSANETGQVIGRAEYLHAEPSYYVRYTAADGRRVEAWWGDSALSEV